MESVLALMRLHCAPGLHLKLQQGPLLFSAVRKGQAGDPLRLGFQSSQFVTQAFLGQQA